MALHGIDVSVFTELGRSYQSEQDPLQVCDCPSVRLSLSFPLSLCLYRPVSNIFASHRLNLSDCFKTASFLKQVNRLNVEVYDVAT